MKCVFSNQFDFFVARSLEECVDLAKKYYLEIGYDQPCEEDLNFEPCYPITKLFGIKMDDITVYKSYKDWAEESDIGFLASSEY